MTDQTPPYGQPTPQYQAPVYQAPAYPGAAGGPGGSGGSRRPGAVTAATVLTYIGAPVLAVCGLIMLIVPLVPSIARDAVASGDFGDMTVAEVRILFGVIGAVFLLLGVALIVLAAHTGRGRGGARIALTVIGVLFVVMGAISAVDSPGTLVPVLYVALAVLLLWVGGANAWFRAQKAARKAAVGAPGGPPTAPPAGPQAPPFPG